MKSYPTFDHVVDELGEKVTEGLASVVAHASADLSLYRSEHPDWAAAASDGGLAGWIHDRMWAHAEETFFDDERVDLRVKGSTREIWVGFRYRLRLKRHHEDGGVAMYPTATALDFVLQPPTLPGFEEIRLIAGYLWDRDARAMGEPTLSLRDGWQRIIWMNELTPPSSAGIAQPASPIVSPQIDGPSKPGIVVERDETEGEERGDEKA